MRLAILTVSDRAARGERDDRSGPVLTQLAKQQGWEVVASALVPDEDAQIESQLRGWSDTGQVDLILTTGGTGFGPRDRTPEATRAVCDRLAPGIAEAMRAAGLAKTPHAMLSRAVAGIRARTLIINLPGSPRAVRENMQVVMSALPHAISVLRGDESAEAGHGEAPPRHA